VGLLVVAAALEVVRCRIEWCGCWDFAPVPGAVGCDHATGVFEDSASVDRDLLWHREPCNTLFIIVVCLNCRTPGDDGLAGPACRKGDTVRLEGLGGPKTSGSTSSLGGFLVGPAPLSELEQPPLPLGPAGLLHENPEGDEAMRDGPPPGGVAEAFTLAVILLGCLSDARNCVRCTWAAAAQGPLSVKEADIGHCCPVAI